LRLGAGISKVEISAGVPPTLAKTARVGHPDLGAVDESRKKKWARWSYGRSIEERFLNCAGRLLRRAKEKNKSVGLLRSE
jgi:hypothetical protein